MKSKSLCVLSIILTGLLDASAEPKLSADAQEWCNWTNPNVGVTTGFYANAGTYTVAKDGNGIFGEGLGEVSFTSNNEAPVPVHQFGSALWKNGSPQALFNSAELAGKAGIEILVNVDASSTSDKISINLSAADEDFYSLTVPVEKGSIQLVQFPLADFKSEKNPGATLTDFSVLTGTIQISDGWNGYPKPAQETWISKFSNIYTYGGSHAAPSGKPPAKTSK